MLDSDDRKILGHFVRACNLLVLRIITEDNLNEAQERLKDMAYLIENAYGDFAIEREETQKKINFIFICQKYFKCYNLFRFYINSFFIFFGVFSLSIAK